MTNYESQITNDELRITRFVAVASLRASLRITNYSALPEQKTKCLRLAFSGVNV